MPQYSPQKKKIQSKFAYMQQNNQAKMNINYMDEELNLKYDI